VNTKETHTNTDMDRRTQTQTQTHTDRGRVTVLSYMGWRLVTEGTSELAGLNGKRENSMDNMHILTSTNMHAQY
jgi:hypothetical protein